MQFNCKAVYINKIAKQLIQKIAKKFIKLNFKTVNAIKLQNSLCNSIAKQFILIKLQNSLCNSIANQFMQFNCKAVYINKIAKQFMQLNCKADYAIRDQAHKWQIEFSY